VFSTDSNLIVDFAWIVGIFCTLTSIFMILFVIWFRRFVAATDSRQELVDEKWEKALFSIVSSRDNTSMEISELLESFRQEEKHNRYSLEAVITRRESPHFLYSWNYLQESLRGDAKIRLNSFAKKLAVEEKANALLKSKMIKRRILALNTLGNLRAKTSYERVKKFAFKKDPIVSVWAFRAMFRIKQEKTRDRYLYLIAEREDWSPAYVAKILKDKGGNVISKKLVELTEESYRNELNETQMSRLVSYLKFAHVEDYALTVQKLLKESNQMEVLISCMRILKSEESLPEVRRLLKDERWELRMFSVITLGRFGHKQDLTRLISTLNDLNWWVRYSSARALMSFPPLTKNNVRKLAGVLPNEFQRDILKQILAEDEFQCLNQSSTVLSN